MSNQVLTSGQLDQFMQSGWCQVEDCFSPEAAKQKRDLWVEEHGLDPANPLGWGKEIIHSFLKQDFSARDFAPKAWAAAEDLVGKDSFEDWRWSSFIVNIRLGRSDPWRMPPKEKGGWHVDGDFFHHFLDSPEQGLLILQIFSDIEPEGGGTVISEDSWPSVTRVLYDHPEGLDPGAICVLGREASPFQSQREVTGKAGTVVFCHPFLMHASSQNCKGGPRFAMNAPIHLKKPMRFDDWERASWVEKSVIKALGGKPFEFKIRGERRKYTPDRTKYSK
jgi:hypothetical protein